MDACATRRGPRMGKGIPGASGVGSGYAQTEIVYVYNECYSLHRSNPSPVFQGGSWMNFCRFRKTVLALFGGVRVGAGGWGVASSVDMKPTNMHTPRSGFTQTTEYPASSRWTFYDDSTASHSCECEHFSRRGVAAPLAHAGARAIARARALDL